VKEWTPAQVPAEFDEKTGMCYETVKKQFEETHFIVEAPRLWSTNNGDFCTKQDFEMSALEFQFYGGNGKSKDLFPTWIRDKQKRKYKTVECAPFNPRETDPTPDHVLNVAEPFKFAYILQAERRPDGLSDFKFILEHICCSEATRTYMLHYFAHLLQFPRVNPQVAPVLKGHMGGVGKDSIYKLMTALLGAFWTVTTDDMERVFGKFNSLLDHKLLVQLNEVEGGQGAKFINKLKGRVTQKLNIIKEENIKPHTQTNNVRYLGSSNNLNPMPYDRRLCLIQTLVHKLISDDPGWWGDFYDNKITDQHYLDSLGSDLLDIDLSQVNVMEPPETAGSKTKKMQKILPVHRVLQKLADGEFDSSTGVYEMPKMEGVVGFTKKWFVERVMEHCPEQPNKKDIYKNVESWALEYPACFNTESEVRPWVNGKQLRLPYTLHKANMLLAMKKDSTYVTKEEAEDYMFL
jgi:hypothetical protein